MTFEQVIYTGPSFDDPDILARVPVALAALLVEDNGVVAYDGGLHIRGACQAPDWHSLREAWLGATALFRLFPALSEADVPFAEDMLGDQFLLRDGVVFRLAGETGDLQSLDVSFEEFVAHVRADPIGFLSLQPLLAFSQTGGRLVAGQLLNVYPPFCTTFAGERSYRAVPALEQRDFLGALAGQIRELPDGTAFTFKITP
jgi:hypothetical protein